MEHEMVGVAAIDVAAHTFANPRSTRQVPPEVNAAFTIVPEYMTLTLADVKGKLVHILPPADTATLVAPLKEKLTVTTRPILV